MISFCLIVYIVCVIISFFGLAFREDCFHLYDDDLESSFLAFFPVVNIWTAWYVLNKYFRSL